MHQPGPQGPGESEAATRAARLVAGGPLSGSPAFYREALARLTADERYEKNVQWGEPRDGHPEGPICAHIADLERNAAVLDAKLSETDRVRLRLLVHSHDTFKPDADDVKISHPRSHASLARVFLEEYCPDDASLLDLVQYHDEPYALWRQVQHARLNWERYDALFARVREWDLFLAFLIVDGCTEGKSRDPLRWFFGEAERHGVRSVVTAADIL